MVRSFGLVVLLSVMVFLITSASLVEAKEGKGLFKHHSAKLESVEKTGTIEVTPGQNKKFPEITIKVDNEVFKLLPGKGNKGIMKKLEALAGKTVTVKGVLLPANPPKHPMAAIRVESFTEVGGSTPTTAAPAASNAPTAAAPAAPSASNQPTPTNEPTPSGK